jgi:hypothetical protein
MFCNVDTVGVMGLLPPSPLGFLWTCARLYGHKSVFPGKFFMQPSLVIIHRKIQNKWRSSPGIVRQTWLQDGYERQIFNPPPIFLAIYWNKYRKFENSSFFFLTSFNWNSKKITLLLKFSFLISSFGKRLGHKHRSSHLNSQVDKVNALNSVKMEFGHVVASNRSLLFNFKLQVKMGK